MRYLLAAIVALSFSISANANDKEGHMNQKYAPVLAKEARVAENEKMTLYTIEEDRVQYYITKPNHPAYPYMVKSKVLGRDLDTRFKITGYGLEVDRQAAKDFLKEIEEINAEKVKILREAKEQ